MNILIYTLGCPKNFNDSQVAGGILEAAGHNVVMGNDDIITLQNEIDMDSLDAIMVNTCGFINDAKEESIEAIFDMATYDKLLIVSGCLPQRYGEELYKEIPEVDVFVGVNEYDRLPKILENHKEKQEVYISEYSYELETEYRKMDGEAYAATVKISEGCDNRCAYCAIPKIRGPYRSRPKELIITEVEKLAVAGTKEIILIAQDTTNYGIDIYGKYALSDLLNELCEIEGIKWIRLMYCYEDRITEELIDTIANQEKICNYLDIPIQHISDSVLQSMRRKSTTKSIKGKLALLRKKIPDINIRTTLIVGFPGESEEDFNQLYDFVEEEKFERLGVFSFSPEEGTPAYTMNNQIDEEIKEKRKDLIMKKQMEISLSSNQKKVGKILEVLCEGRDDTGSYIGRSRYDAPGIDNQVIFSSRKEIKTGEIVKVRILDAFDYDLVGELA